MMCPAERRGTSGSWPPREEKPEKIDNTATEFSEAERAAWGYGKVGNKPFALNDLPEGHRI